MAFDLSALALKESSDLHLRHPATEEQLFDGDEPIVVSIFGTASKQYRKAINAMQNRSLKRGNKKATAEQLQEEGIEILVACSEKSNLTLDGETLDNPDAFRRLYSDDRYSWVKSQVDAFLVDTESFIGA